MMQPVGFHYQFAIHTNEVRDIRADRLLAPEADSELVTTEALPEGEFWRGERLAHR
jgi:hypothetical protein